MIHGQRLSPAQADAVPEDGHVGQGRCWPDDFVQEVYLVLHDRLVGGDVAVETIAAAYVMASE